MSQAVLERMVDRVREARSQGRVLDIRGGGSKSFYGRAPRGEAFEVRELRGITSHEPSELVVTALGGTPLAELEAALAERGQCLPFEPPHYAGGATVGGMAAAGLSGPARAAVGSARDYVLGATLLNGRGEVLRFGGTVMKNVAGYDVSRLLVGSFGMFGVICELSLKVLPMVPAMATLRFAVDQSEALAMLNGWRARPWPVRASSWHRGELMVRLGGAAAAVDSACKALGGEAVDEEMAGRHWRGVRDQRHSFFSSSVVGAADTAVADSVDLWRISVPPTAPPLAVRGEQLLEWGGALRWVVASEPAAQVRAAAHRAGGHATLFRARDAHAERFSPLSPALQRIHRELKLAFDPDRVFNPGRLYPDL